MSKLVASEFDFKLLKILHTALVFGSFFSFLYFPCLIESIRGVKLACPHILILTYREILMNFMLCFWNL